MPRKKSDKLPVPGPQPEDLGTAPTGPEDDDISLSTLFGKYFPEELSQTDRMRLLLVNLVAQLAILRSELAFLVMRYLHEAETSEPVDADVVDTTPPSDRNGLK